MGSADQFVCKMLALTPVAVPGACEPHLGLRAGQEAVSPPCQQLLREGEITGGSVSSRLLLPRLFPPGVPHTGTWSSIQAPSRRGAAGQLDKAQATRLVLSGSPH